MKTLLRGVFAAALMAGCAGQKPVKPVPPVPPAAGEPVNDCNRCVVVQETN